MADYASAVIRNNKNEFLTINHFKKTVHPWRFVGGKIEENEMPLVACARELKEELGIEASGMRFAGMFSTFVDGNTWHGYFYEITDFDGVPTIQEPEKHSDLCWLTAAELKARGSEPEWRVALGILVQEGDINCIVDAARVTEGESNVHV